MKQSAKAPQAVPAPAKAGTAALQAPAAPVATVAQPSLSIAEMKALGRELSNQLESANSRRDDLNKQLQNPGVANRAGLEVRVAQLDNRISNLEAQIELNGKNLTSNPAALAGTSTAAFGAGRGNGMSGGQATGLGIVMTIFVLFPLALTASRLLWRRGTRPQPVGPSHEEIARLDNIERGIEAIAIEMERVTEGQRFVTKLMSEKQPVRIEAKS